MTSHPPYKRRRIDASDVTIPQEALYPHQHIRNEHSRSPSYSAADSGASTPLTGQLKRGFDELSVSTARHGGGTFLPGTVEERPNSRNSDERAKYESVVPLEIGNSTSQTQA